MGKRQTAAQTTTPQVDQESPNAATGELTGLQAELVRAQQLAGAGNAYVQDQLNQQAAASVEAVQAASAEAVAVSQSPEAEVADVEQAIEEAKVAVEGAEEGGGITGDAPPSDAGGASVEVAAEAATGGEETVSPEGAAPAHAESGGEAPDARTQVKKEFGKVYRATSSAETDAWLDALQAREATEPELAGLAAELRSWTLEQRAAKAAKAAATTATAPPATTGTEASPSSTTTLAPVEEPGGLWAIWAGIKDVMSAAWEGLKSIPERIGSWWSALWADEGTEGAAKGAESRESQGRAQLDALFSAERLTTEQIAEARALIEAEIPAEERGDWYERLQSKVEYHNQRNNESPSEGDNGGTCNLTSLAMCLQYLGVPNPDPSKQYEDALDDIRIANKYGKITSFDTWTKISAHLGKTLTFHSGGTFDQAWFEETMRGWLQGSGVLCSIHGHVVRVEAVTAEGLKVDDPFGQSLLKARANGKAFSWVKGGLNEREDDGTAEGNLGEDHVWPWDSVTAFSFNYFGVLQ
ncbi:hypothetical protein L6R46_26590 [Myxococcota bacterium]|nr:hypothetical protein [Myxococcota bacterium]